MFTESLRKDKFGKATGKHIIPNYNVAKFTNRHSLQIRNTIYR